MPTQPHNPSSDLPVHSFFTGAGFLDLGFESAGFLTKSINETHEPFIQGFQHGSSKVGRSKTPEIFNNSITDFLDGSKKFKPSQSTGLPVGFIGGPPCPDFSIAGKQRGKLGPNGRLTGSYAQLICDHQPDWFLFENVKGLWSTKKHLSFYNEICNQFISNGFVLTSKLVNSLEYGVPQLRDRVILIGFNAKNCGKKPGWLPSEDFPWNDFTKYSKDEVLKRPWPTVDKFDSNPQFHRRTLKRLTAEYWFNKNETNIHANSADFFQPRAALHRFETIDEGDVSGKSFKRLHRWRFSPTVAYGNNEVHIHPYETRRISVAEALSLQSLPKAFELPEDMTLSNKFKTIGNGVPFLLSEGIAKSIYTFLEKHF